MNLNNLFDKLLYNSCAANFFLLNPEVRFSNKNQKKRDITVALDMAQTLKNVCC